MTQREVYDYLFRPQQIEKEIKALEGRRETYLTMLLPQGIRYDKERVDTSLSDSMAAVMAKVDDINSQIINLRLERNALLEGICRNIDKVKDAEERIMLEKYYIHRKTVEQIAFELPCSRRTAFELKKRAIDSLSKIL